MARRPRILFVSEAVTLAQVVRLVALAGALHPESYDVQFAAGDFVEDSLVFRGTIGTRHPLDTVPRAEIEAKISRGEPLYDLETLERYLRADLALFDLVRPDLVVGDFRLSLIASAPLWGVPYAALINAYWSPYAVRRKGFPLPDHPLVDRFGDTLARLFFPLARPSVFRRFARPVNELRRRHRLPEIGSLEEVLVAGDHTLYADTAGLVPTRGAPAHHRYLGPVLWSPGGELDVPDSFGRDRTVYVTMGSSGRLDTAPLVVEALVERGFHVILATAGRWQGEALGSERVAVRAFVPGDQAARRACLVVCNGGSSTGYQALAEGTPILGLASNLDQALSMSFVEEAGAGVALRAGAATQATVAAAIDRALLPAIRLGAARVRDDFAAHDAGSAFRAFVDESLAGST